MTTVSLWTVGHSNHTVDRFLELLASERIEVLVDVRSAPYSRFSTHFNRAPLEKAVKGAGLGYLFLGRELGGRPADDDAYDAEGHARYDLMASAPRFLEGLERLKVGVERFRVAVMCSEEDPSDCHRRLLVGKVLTDRGEYQLHHLRGDGSVQIEDAVRLGDGQPSLFEEGPPWRSTQSVSHRSRLDGSSTS
jgi:uncharacterized protein (DUF488 family)